MKTVIVKPSALRDLRRYALRIGRDRPSSAEDFIDAAYRTFQQLALTPEIGVPYLI